MNNPDIQEININLLRQQLIFILHIIAPIVLE